MMFFALLQGRQCKIAAYLRSTLLSDTFGYTYLSRNLLSAAPFRVR